MLPLDRLIGRKTHLDIVDWRASGVRESLEVIVKHGCSKLDLGSCESIRRGEQRRREGRGYKVVLTCPK